VLASVTLFDVSQARHTRKAPDFYRRKSQEDGSAVLLDSFLDIRAHLLAHAVYSS
jgi:hypothetical protein